MRVKKEEASFLYSPYFGYYVLTGKNFFLDYSRQKLIKKRGIMEY